MNYTFNINSSQLRHSQQLRNSQQLNINNQSEKHYVINQNTNFQQNKCGNCEDNIIHINFFMKKYIDGTIVFTVRPTPELVQYDNIQIERLYYINTFNSQYIDNKEDICITYTNLEDLKISIKNDIYDKIKPNKINMNIIQSGKIYQIIGDFTENMFVYKTVK
jgi:hypothetical protein